MKDRITITVDKELLAWLDAKIEERIFANRSHGVEYLIRQKIKQEKEGKRDQTI
jgi:metal-responsive CopG/Arc/MetJ family transcriptional regulator